MKLLAVAGRTLTGPMVNFLASLYVCVYVCMRACVSVYLVLMCMCVCVCLAISRFDQIFKANEQDGHMANFSIKQRTQK